MRHFYKAGRDYRITGQVGMTGPRSFPGGSVDMLHIKNFIKKVASFGRESSREHVIQYFVSPLLTTPYHNADILCVEVRVEDYPSIYIAAASILIRFLFLRY